MAEPAVSLLGRLSERVACSYLKRVCVLPDKSDSGLRKEWEKARAQIGPPVAKAGQPEILEIPYGYDTQLRAVVGSPAFADAVQGLTWSFKLIEIDPILAFQIHVSLERSANLWKNAGDVPDVGEMLPRCLPTALEDVPCDVSPSGNSLSISSRSMNVRFGPIDASGTPHVAELTIPNPRQLRTVGIQFFPAVPFVQVIRFRERCFLRNGYHRVYGFGMAGATHVPCLYLEGASDYTQVGISRDSFQPEVLESARPPTLGDFVGGRAHQIHLMRQSQEFRISWTYNITLTKF